MTASKIPYLRRVGVCLVLVVCFAVLIACGRGILGGERGTRLPRAERGVLVRGLALSPDGKLVAAADTYVVYVWDLATRRKQGQYEDVYLKAFAFSANSEHLATAGGNSVSIWDSATHTQVRS